MTTVLDRDLGGDAFSRFGGRLFKATLKHVRPVTMPPADPTNVTQGYDTYGCDAIAFGYKIVFVDGEKIRKGDYRVVILRRSFTQNNVSVDDVTPAPDDIISVPPPGGTVALNAKVIAVEVITEAQFTVQVRGVKAG